VPTVNLFDPYVEYGRPLTGGGYMPARSESPSQHSRDRGAEGSYTSGASRRTGSKHVPEHGTGSTDPLLSGAIPLQAIPEPVTLTYPSVPPRNPGRLDEKSEGRAGGSGSRNNDERAPPVYRTGDARDQRLI
jgi:hypothetical protein